MRRRPKLARCALTPQEKAFRRYLAELVRYLALRRRDQVRQKDKAYALLGRLVTKTHDRESYLFRIGRSLTYEGRHRRARDKPSRVQRS